MAPHCSAPTNYSQAREHPTFNVVSSGSVGGTVGCAGGPPPESRTGPPRHRGWLFAVNNARDGCDRAGPGGALSAPRAPCPAGPKQPSGLLARSPPGRRGGQPRPTQRRGPASHPTADAGHSHRRRARCPSEPAPRDRRAQGRQAPRPTRTSRRVARSFWVVGMRYPAARRGISPTPLRRLGTICLHQDGGCRHQSGEIRLAPNSPSLPRPPDCFRRVARLWWPIRPGSSIRAPHHP